MAAFLKVSTERMTSDAREIDNMLETIPQMIDELEAAMGTLSNCWEGAAWDAYQANVAYYVELLTDVYDRMKNYVVKLEESSQEYKRAEQDICMKIKCFNTVI